MFGMFGKWLGKNRAQETRLLDPKDVLFSLPTLCEVPPPYATKTTKPPKDSIELHEDDWRQIEFVAATNLRELERTLSELEFFKKAHEVEGCGWKQLFMRPEWPVALASLGLTLRQSGGRPLAVGHGLVHQGFAFPDSGSEWFLYGHRNPAGTIAQLSVCPGQESASWAFASSVFEWANDYDLLLVDWYGVRLVDTSSASSIQEWTEGYGA